MIITDCSFVNDLFDGNSTEATEALLNYTATANNAFLSTNFTWKDQLGNEATYTGYGFTLYRIELCHPAFNDTNATIPWDMDMLIDVLISNDLLKHRVSHSLVLLMTSRIIKNKYDREYNGFSAGPICSDKNVAVVSFHRCGLSPRKEVASCIRTIVHELSHSYGGEDDTIGDDVMSPI